MAKRTGVFFLTLMAFTVAAQADDWDRTYQVQGRPRMVVEADDGNVTVDSGKNGSVHMSVHSEGWRIAPDEIDVRARQDGNHVELTLRKRTTGLQVHFSASLDIHITLPAGSDIEIRTRDGNLRINGIEGTQKLRSGDGNAEVRGVEGSVDLDTGDGNIFVDGRFDALSLSTGDGNIHAVVRSGSAMSSAWSLHTGDGNISLTLPANLAADVEAHTGDGHVRSDIPIATSRTPERDNDLRGKINGGGQVLTVRTGDGDIEIGR